MITLPNVGDPVIVPYRYGRKDRRLVVTRIADTPFFPAGIPGSPAVIFATGKHPRNGKLYDFCVYPNNGSCAC